MFISCMLLFALFRRIIWETRGRSGGVSCYSIISISPLYVFCYVLLSWSSTHLSSFTLHISLPIPLSLSTTSIFSCHIFCLALGLVPSCHVCHIFHYSILSCMPYFPLVSSILSGHLKCLHTCTIIKTRSK